MKKFHISLLMVGFLMAGALPAAALHVDDNA